MSKLETLRKSKNQARNPHGVLVRKCCASCIFKELTESRKSRFCIMYQKEVRPERHCDKWEMSEQMMSAGKSGGRIKRRAYLMYVLNIRAVESLAEEQGFEIQPRSINQIRAEYEQEFGSIYLDF